jgi:hypothetical protein
MYHLEEKKEAFIHHLTWEEETYFLVALRNFQHIMYHAGMTSSHLHSEDLNFLC